jgi:hypothetical protein
MKELTMSNNLIESVATLISEALGNKSEQYEVAIYIAARHALLQSAEAGLNGNQTEISVPPESIRLLAKYDMGLTDIEVYMSNWSAIRAFKQVDDIETRTKSLHLRRAEQTDEKDSKRVVRDLVSPRYSALTYVVSVAKGRAAAEEFDFELKRLTTINEAQSKFFKNASD